MFAAVLNNNLKRINKLAAPVLLSYLTGFLFTLADQAIIGRTSLNAYAAVSVVSNLLYAITGTLGIISLALNINGSKMLGENNKKGYAELFSTAMSLSIIIGLLFEIIYLSLGKIILKSGFNMSEDLLGYGYRYLIIAGLGTGLNMIIFIFSSFYKTIEKTGVLLTGSIISNFINIALDYVLVFGKFGFPELGVTGAAIGTAAGLAVNVLIYWIKQAFIL